MTEVAVHRGMADIVVKFSGPRDAVWIIDLALNSPGGASEKLKQVQHYAGAFNAAEVFCCALVVKHVKPASASGNVEELIDAAWSRQTQTGWETAAVEPAGDATDAAASTYGE